jgi:hypothetical protein
MVEQARAIDWGRMSVKVARPAAGQSQRRNMLLNNARLWRGASVWEEQHAE